MQAKEIEKFENGKPMRRIIAELEVSQCHLFPIEKMLVIRSCCSELGAISKKKFSTSLNREDRTITVTRIS